MDEADAVVMLANELQVRVAEASASVRALVKLIDEMLAVLQEQAAAEAIGEAALVSRKY